MPAKAKATVAAPPETVAPVRVKEKVAPAVVTETGTAQAEVQAMAVGARSTSNGEEHQAAGQHCCACICRP